MKKILFISQYSPETRIVGDMVYTWDILRTLKHDSSVYVHFLAYQDKNKWYENETKALSQLVDKVTMIPFSHLKAWQMTLSLYPASMKNRANGEMLSAMRKILDNEHFDFVMFNSLKMAYLVRNVHESGTHCIYISHNIEAEVSKSIYKTTRNIIQKFIYWQDYIKTAWWEKRLIRHFDAITTICSYDANYFLNGHFKGLVQVIRPIVQVSPYESQKPHTGKLIICGSFTWLPKKLNLNKILDSNSIANLLPNDCRLQVVGRAMNEEIEKGNKLPGVHVTGPVDDVNPYYDDAEVAIVPELAGGGFKLKIAEAVVHHIPIVAIKGSITDSNMLAGIHYIEATNFDELLDKAIALAHDREAQRTLTGNIVKLFLETYSIDAVSRDMMKVIAALGETDTH
jgi:glycosyltransferase involved in cell wall biosynthesis